MGSLTWQRMGHASNIARHLRAVNRVSQPTINGHSYAYPDLKELWLSDDETHIVLTHNKDPLWQHWYDGPDGWRPVSVHSSQDTAIAAAEAYREEMAPLGPGTYVIARADDRARAIRVRCRSTDGPEALKVIFTKLGYGVQIEKVSA